MQSTLSPNSFSRPSLKATQKGYLVKLGSSKNKKFLICQTQYPPMFRDFEGNYLPHQLC